MHRSNQAHSISSDAKDIDAALVWFRRDLRAYDNAALYHALKAARKLYCVFVFDRHILDPLLEEGLNADRRVEFIHGSVAELNDALNALGREHCVDGVRLLVLHDHADTAVPKLADALHVQAVYANHDDEPQALERDAKVRGRLADLGIALHTSKDHVIFERSEVVSQSGKPYSVFTPYKKAWLDKVDPFYLSAYPVEKHAAALAEPPVHKAHGTLPTLESMGFEKSNLEELKIKPGSTAGHALLADFMQRIDDYGQTRNFPSVKGPSYLSVHLRFGTVSIRELARQAWTRVIDAPMHRAPGAGTWLSELVWRDFYHQILHFHPHVVGHAFKPDYDHIRFLHGKHAQELFEAWCEGRTGYPLVDAAMAQINHSGYMHNRLRMVTASFLIKDLGIDWRWGERYFARALNDYDLAANNGGWQWASSSGCDAQPYFRIFNPVTQSEKFDADGAFIRRYLPQLAKLSNKLIHAPWMASPIELAAAGIELGRDYPRPIVDHAEARDRTLERYSVVKSKALA
ncbi:deoxyribodipyrimidine photo-lyase [soil metagenome]